MSNNQTVLDKGNDLHHWAGARTAQVKKHTRGLGLNPEPLCSPQNKTSVLMGPRIEKHVNINSSKK